ncbi:MAG: PEGA domain-containing protein [Polyangiaceae bacterium]
MTRVAPRRSWPLPAALALSMMTAAANVAAQPAGSPQSEGRERYERGVDLFAQKDFGGALAEFQRAYQLTPYSVVLYNLGLTYAALGRPVEAVDTLQKVLDAPGSLSAERVAQARAVRAEQAARVAELSIVSTVEGARIEIDGAEVAKAPLAAPLRIKAGPHRVGVVLSGYVPSRKEVDTPAGTRTEVRFELVATDRRLGLLTVKTRLPGAQLLVDGDPVAVTPLPGPIALMPGQRKIELRRPGYQAARTELSVGEGENAEVSLEPEEDVAAVRAGGAQLALDITEPDAVVTVDGRARGAYLGALALPPGAHRLRIERAGFFTVERDVDVSPRRLTTLRVELEPTAETRASYTSSARTWRTLGWIGVGAGAALAAGGAAYLGYNGGKKSDSDGEVAAYNQSTTDPGGACNEDSLGFDGSICKQRRDEVLARQAEVYDRDVLGWVGIAAGGAVLAAGVVVLLVGDDPGRYDREPSDELIASPRARPWAVLGPGQGMVGLSGSF